MIELRQPVATVGFIDEYCKPYRNVFSDLRLYECFKYLHVGMLSQLPRKTLPEIEGWWDSKMGKVYIIF